jgi:hypothetical protein
MTDYGFDVVQVVQSGYVIYRCQICGVRLHGACLLPDHLRWHLLVALATDGVGL